MPVGCPRAFKAGDMYRASATQFRNLSLFGSVSKALLLGAFATFATFDVSVLCKGIFIPQDEGILLVYPDLILRGYIPYKDFAALYPPAEFYLLAGVFRVFGESVFIERFLGALYSFSVVIAIFSIGSRVSRTTGALAATTALAYTSLFGSFAARTHLGAYACTLFALALASRDCSSSVRLARRSLLFAGVAAASALCFKQDLGVVAIVATLVSIDPRNPRLLRPFLAGVAILVCAVITFAIIVGPGWVFDGLISDAIRSAPGRFLPLHLSWDLVVIAVCVSAQCVIAVRVRGLRVSHSPALLARGMAMLSLAYSLSMLHRTEPGDIGSYGFLVVSLTIVSFSIFLLHSDIGPEQRSAALVSLFLAGLLPIGILYFSGASESLAIQHWVFSEGRRVPVDDYGHSKSSDLQDLLDAINRMSRSGDRVFVGPRDLRFANANDTFIYYLLPRLQPVSRYLEMNPGCANRLGSGLTEEISRADWLILTTRYDHWREPNASSAPGPMQPNEVVRKHFCLRSKHGDWLLLQRCVLGSDGSTHGS